MEETGILSIEDIGWYVKESVAPWTMTTATTKRNLMALMNCIAKFGYDSNKSMNEIFRPLHDINKKSDDSTAKACVNPRKRKPK